VLLSATERFRHCASRIEHTITMVALGELDTVGAVIMMISGGKVFRSCIRICRGSLLETVSCVESTSSA
jgi:hypothetical protein